MAKQPHFPIWLVLITGILSALLGGVIVYGVSQGNESEPRIVQQIIERIVLADPEEEEEQETPVISLDVENWKQFDNFEFGYSIKYPEEFSRDTAETFQIPTRNIVGFDEMQGEFVEEFIQEPYLLRDFAGKLFVQVFVGSLDRVERDLEIDELEHEEITIGDIDAVLVTRDVVSMLERMIIIERGEQIILIGGMVEADEVELYEAFYSTFELTGTAAIDEWPTYTNSKYGFSFEYPPNKTPFVDPGDSPDEMIAADEDASYIAIAVREPLLYESEANMITFEVIEEETDAVGWIEKQKPDNPFPPYTLSQQHFTFHGAPAIIMRGAGSLGSPAMTVVAERADHLLMITIGIGGVYPLNDIFDSIELF